MAKKSKPTRPNKRTDDEFMEQLSALMREVWGDSPQMREFAAFTEKTMRIHLAMDRALEALRESDRATYLRIAALIHRNDQPFLDAVSRALAEEGEDEHLDARMESSPSSFAVGSLLTNHGFQLRAALIHLLKDKPSAKDIVPLLEELQELLPEPKPGDDTDS